MFIWNKHHSSFFGLFSGDEQTIQFLPHRMSAADATLVMEWFDSIAFAKFSSYLQAMPKASVQISSDPSVFLN
jgi:hypothetical protein